MTSYFDRVAKSVAYRIEFAARRYCEARETRRLLENLSVDPRSSLSVEEARVIAILSRYSNRFERLVDIGAHRGRFTASLACAFDFTEIVCVEPDVTVLEELNSAVPLHSRIVACAISDTEGSAVLYQHPDRSMNSLQAVGRDFEAVNPFYGKGTIETVRIETMTLDSLLAVLEPSGSRDIILKLDVQGAERRVLAGGTKFMNDVSVVVMEQMFWRGYEDSWQLREMVERMSDLGFHPFEVLKVAYRGNRPA